MQKLKLLKREKLLFLTPFLFLIVPILAHWRQDRLDKAQIRLAGANAINCGVGHSATVENNVVTKDRAVVDACAVAAFTQKKPFRARFNETTDRIETKPFRLA